ncbi:hypothetical protein FACS189418_3060 [Clostridia bacterium]|nr:hypothetical protein FACS189418_3060 [Clostridia bacterium]
MIGKEKHKKQLVFIWLIFIIYMSLLIYFLFFAELMDRQSRPINYSYNLKLFTEIKRFIRSYERLGFYVIFLNLVGNIVGFVPFGFILPLITKRAKHWYMNILLGFTFSMWIETFQLVFRVGIFDVDDMFLNTLGSFIGFVTYFLLIHKKSHLDYLI